MDIFPITKNNFTSSVLKSKDPWVLIFHQGSMIRGWKAMSVSARGIVWMGMIDQYNVEKDPPARVYPYGNKKMKQEKWEAVKTPNEARQIAMESLPDRVTKLKGKEIQSFLMDSFTSHPSRFPTIMFTDELQSPMLLKGLANRFQKYFNFGCIIQPTFKDYEYLGIEEFVETPLIMVLIPRKPGITLSDKLEFSALQYNEKTMGKMDYPNVMQFLFAVNNQYRYWLPGDNQSNSKEEAEMSDIVEKEQLRFNILSEGKQVQGHKQESIEDLTMKAETINHVTRDEL
ncbi:hypothetical protein KUTeg_017077 [Tegillarca granosa]|uniref:Uncharacterized protein n=1 Tax=Tegillarca granosa TaxID=220873 RepID=A0ABQ9EMN8_TEGGR|nr:hypothetical protein KUTeg_017077 [Tegillarca granosa]